MMRNNTSITKPVEPKKEDCCNSGCSPCIFDIYEKKLKMYDKYLNNGELLQFEENGISELEYTKFIVMKNLSLGCSHNLIMFKNQSPDSNKVWWRPGDHFLYKYVSNNISCTRAYTPLNNQNVTKENNDFAIIIKTYENGVVSPHLSNLTEGSVTLWRGPYGHYKIEPNRFQRIIMIAQGTGIAPFITIINSILNNDDEMARIFLIYCCKSLSSILFRDDLYAYKSFWNFHYNVYLSEFHNSADIKYQEPVISRKFNPELLLHFEPFSNNDQFLICGSQEYNKEYEKYLQERKIFVDNIVLF